MVIHDLSCAFTPLMELHTIEKIHERWMIRSDEYFI
jgi:hypothetical protein